MCSIICTIPPSWLRAASPTKWSMRARLAAEAHKPVAKCKVPVFMGDRKLKKETNAPFDCGQNTSCATEINKCLVAKVSPVSQALMVEPWNVARGCSCLVNMELWASGSTELHVPKCLTTDDLVCWLKLTAKSLRGKGLTNKLYSSLDLFCPQFINLIHGLQPCSWF